jgi:putative SOS response-associated peptidase YedK
MCGLFVSSSPPDEIARYFDVDQTAEQVLEQRPNYNTAPTTDVFVVYEDGATRRLDTFHWGLVPGWAKDLSVGNRMINARAETVASKPAFRRAFAKRRCILPVDGFYEWKAVPGQKRKQPYFIHRPDGEPYAFAGLWEQWRGTLPTGGPGVPEDADDVAEDTGEEVTVRSVTIITGAANEPMSEIHDRMPVILPPSAWAQWLSPEEHDVEALGRFLVPAPPELITFHPVSTDVNSVRNKGEYLVDEVDPVAEDGRLL